MKTGGLVPLSLIDYPGRPCAVVFTQGCNFRCAFCHNPHLVLPGRMEPSGDPTEILNFLDSRQGRLDAVVVSGGEPCMQPDLPDFLAEIKVPGYAVKLDTNGSYPAVLEAVINEGLVDYIAMDIKGPLERYSSIAGVAVDTSAIIRSIALIEESGLPYVFRTTVAAPLVGTEDIPLILDLIQDTTRLVLQPCRAEGVLDPSRVSDTQLTEAELAAWAALPCGK